MTDHAVLRARATVERYLELLAAADVDGVIALFTGNGTVVSPLYGTLPATRFYPKLVADTQRSEIVQEDLFVSVHDPRRVAVQFRYGWTMSDGTKTSFDCIDTIELDDVGRIVQLRIIYDTHPLRSAWAAIRSTT
ncbi:nuclear transport factor 2 family protein [Allokutzneria sp. A3M-2-11 16]|uniref:nuclear transport factor 2 family protein n=1 Tax=Allokutzneria sp. A3M-2-11 16 TaxID=2962043 RepID=UPI0020B6B62B|nr:nuclear transport factor 2 family protein [Allokutzneria sp. A3M-2-11 16]MCP3799527.1 nuclear transport factor 2 family protein [Allokutzneria sp. A3M-2-11 16]